MDLNRIDCPSENGMTEFYFDRVPVFLLKKAVIPIKNNRTVVIECSDYIQLVERIWWPRMITEKISAKDAAERKSTYQYRTKFGKMEVGKVETVGISLTAVAEIVDSRRNSESGITYNRSSATDSDIRSHFFRPLSEEEKLEIIAASPHVFGPQSKQLPPVSVSGDSSANWLIWVGIGMIVLAVTIFIYQRRSAA